MPTIMLFETGRNISNLILWKCYLPAPIQYCLLRINNPVLPFRFRLVGPPTKTEGSSMGIPVAQLQGKITKKTTEDEICFKFSF